MHSTAPRLAAFGSLLATLLGTSSWLVTGAAYGQGQLFPSEEPPEQILITGSLIRGTAQVGVPVSQFKLRDFATTGALTTADLFRTFPAANVSPGPVATNSGGNVDRATRVNLRGLDTGDATRTLLMVDGMRFPAQGNGLCEIDPSIIPAIALDHIDILADGASATYGSDAVAGVINLILKRNMDGAITQLRYTTADGGKNRYQASAIWGRNWDGGQITLSYEWYDESPILGNAHSNLTTDFSPWGLDDRRFLASSIPATLSIGNPVQLGGGNVGTTATLGHGCSNCYAVPVGAGNNFNPGSGGVGPTAPFSASTLNWVTFNTAANSGSNGVRNQFNPYERGWYDAAQQRNAAVVTIDQRLSNDISFYGEGFYSNRRSEFYNPSLFGESFGSVLQNFAVPTINPYYPSGGAPGNLRVNYNLMVESPTFTSANELADRYQLGLHFGLPAGWEGQLWYAETYDASSHHTTGAPNRNAISAALGWTIPAAAATAGTTVPGLGTWTKPATVPYLNLFCDPTHFKCNSDATLAYVSTVNSADEKFAINEKGVKADGPLFDLPGGQTRAAVGATFTNFHLNYASVDNHNTPSLLAPLVTDSEAHQVWAVFTQLNLPIFGEQNSIVLFESFDIELSWRHDQYSNVKGTSNPKLAFNWTPIGDLSIRGAWGTSFRAPTITEIGSQRDATVGGQNLSALTGTVGGPPVTTACVVGADLPPVGSGAWKIQSSTGNGAPGSASACSPSLTAPPGISVIGGAAASDPIRAGGFQGWTGLKPENSTNFGIGFDYAPERNFLKGLDLRATYYMIKITGRLASFGPPNSNSFNDPQIGSFAFIVPTDYRASGLPGAAGCTNNLTPITCAPFEAAVAGSLARSGIAPELLTSILWINDGGTFNKGWQKLDGIDWSASYDWDGGGIGAWNAGIVGTYYLHNKTENVPGAPGSVVTDSFHTTIQSGTVIEARGVESLPRMRYRARLGWTDGPWSVTGFVDYQSHFFHTQSAPPDVNGNFCSPNGGLDVNGGGGTFPCAISGYSNIEPPYYTFDLSLGYETMGSPANEYLRDISIQAVIQNLMDRHSPFEYRIGNAGGFPAALDILKSNQGRTISLFVTKRW